MPFALAHNGIIYNDKELRQERKLPETNIETDSYIAVQLLEQQGKLNFSTIRTAAEALEGTLTLTILDGRDNLYIVKGNNPLTLYHFPRLGLYAYASTEAILRKGLKKGLPRADHSVEVVMKEGYPAHRPPWPLYRGAVRYLQSVEWRNVLQLAALGRICRGYRVHS